MRLVRTAVPLFAVAIVVLVSTAAGAEPRKLNAREIREALTGNSVEGTWGNTPYRSYFQPNGVILYKPCGGPRETGKWRIDEENDLYCGWTARLGWQCYEVYRDGRTIIWGVPGSEQRFSSRIVAGRQL